MSQTSTTPSSPESVRATFTHRKIWSIAWPLMIAWTAIALVRLTDTFVLGHLESYTYLAAVALAGQLYNFAISVCAFLSMGTVSLVSNARGRQQYDEALLWGLRSTVLGIVIALSMVTALTWALPYWLTFLGAEASTFDVALSYSQVRLWGLVPAILMLPLQGLLLGFQQSRWVMGTSIALTVCNGALSMLFSWMWDYREVGVAWATVASQWLAFIITAYGVVRLIKTTRHSQSFTQWTIQWKGLTHKLGYLITVKRDLLIRSICIMTYLQLMIRMSTELTDAHIAAMGILMTFISLSSLIQDGFVTAVQIITAQVWRPDQPRLFLAIYPRLKRWVVGFSSALISLYAFFGQWMIEALTPLTVVIELTSAKLWMVMLYIGFVSWTYFFNACLLGMTETAKLRNTYFISLVLFIAMIIGIYNPNPTFNLLWGCVLLFEVVRLVMLRSHVRRVIRQPTSHMETSTTNTSAGIV